MSYTIHDAIIVTAHRFEDAALARNEAANLGLQTTSVVVSDPNGWCTFLIAPDGSKEGWPESGAGDAAREKWIAWARKQWASASKPPFKGVCLHFVHVRYGDVSFEEGYGDGSPGEPEIADWQDPGIEDEDSEEASED